MGWLFSSCPVVMLEILKAFSKISSRSVEYKLKSKEAYLGGGGRMVLRVNWGPGGVLVSTEWQGFWVPEAAGEGANIHKS